MIKINGHWAYDDKNPQIRIKVVDGHIIDYNMVQIPTDSEEFFALSPEYLKEYYIKLLYTDNKEPTETRVYQVMSNGKPDWRISLTRKNVVALLGDNPSEFNGKKALQFEKIEDKTYRVTVINPPDEFMKTGETSYKETSLKNTTTSKPVDKNIHKTEVVKEDTKSETYSRNMILFGPPGTGKTYYTTLYADAIVNNKSLPKEDEIDYKAIKKQYGDLRYVPAKAPDNGEEDRGQIAFVTFHQSYGYEDFIEGIKPDVSKDGKISYKLEDGIFKRIAKTAHKNPDKNYVIIIDEINRGNISKIFGELITLIEESKRDGNDDAVTAILPYSKEPFSVPNNLYIIGTMNTADRSLTKIDTALRRRFTFIEMMPDTHCLEGIKVEGISIKDLLETMNYRIEFLRGRDHLIGHAWFMELKDEPDATKLKKLGEIFKNKIIPLLQEYFYDDYHKIQIVLGDTENGQHNFISCEKCTTKFINSNDIDEAADCIYKINKNAFIDIETYKKIDPSAKGEHESTAAENKNENPSE